MKTIKEYTTNVSTVKKPIAVISLVAGTLFLTNCSHKGVGSMATNTATPDAAVAEVSRKYSAAQIQEGKLLWAAACIKCHSLIAPEGHSVEKWGKPIAAHGEAVKAHR